MQDQEQEDEELATVSRVVIYALPKLFAKHQAFPARMADILAIPRLISLDLYLDMQKISVRSQPLSRSTHRRTNKESPTQAYEALWDDVTKQLKKGTDSDVLDQAARTLVVFLATTNLSATNQAKVADLERELVVALRTAAGEDVENASFEEDDLAALTASVARIEHLYRVKSLNEALDERDGTAVTSAVELVDGIVARGRRGYKEEEPVRLLVSSSVAELLLTLPLRSTARQPCDSCACCTPLVASPLGGLGRPPGRLERFARPRRRVGGTAHSAREARGVCRRQRHERRRRRQARRKCRQSPFAHCSKSDTSTLLTGADSSARHSCRGSHSHEPRERSEPPARRA